MDGAILNKSLIQFSVDEWYCVHSRGFAWSPTTVGVMASSFQGLLPALVFSTPDLVAGHCLQRHLDTHRQVWLCLLWGHCSVVLGPGAHKVVFVPSEHLWQVWGLILNMIFPLILSCWVCSFALGHGISFFGGIQHSPVDGYSVASCNFRMLAREDACTYSIQPSYRWYTHTHTHTHTHTNSLSHVWLFVTPWTVAC